MANGQQNRGMDVGEGQHEDPRAGQRIVLSPEELRVLKECNNESFWFRCVPLGIVFVGTTQILVNRGVLAPNPRFGALFKNMAAALGAFLIGKMSYQGRCREKILSLENSALAESIRQGKRGVELVRDMSTQGYEGQAADEFESKQFHKNEFSNVGSTVESKGLDDSLRPSMDRETSLYQRPEEHSTAPPGLSYEELRTRNRVEYEKSIAPKPSGAKTQTETQPQLRQPPPSTSSEHSSESTSSWEQSSSTPKGVRRNKYGDIIE